MTTRVYAPVSGVPVELSELPDAVFAQKVMGDGIAIDPTCGELVAPCDAKVTYVHPNGHALTLVTKSQVTLLLHVGIDTVQLKGEGFNVHVHAGDSVTIGQPLIRFDADLIAQKAKSLATVMIVTEPAGLKVIAITHDTVRGGKDEVLEIISGASVTENNVETVEVRSDNFKLSLGAGLHARPAGTLAKHAKAFLSTVELEKRGHRANAKSVTALLALEVGADDEVCLVARGGDAKMAVASLLELLINMHEEVEPVDDRAFEGGIGLSPGLAVGQVVHVRGKQFKFAEDSSCKPEDENRLLSVALRESGEELNKLAERSDIFLAHLEILNDPEIAAECASRIQSGKTAAFSWSETVSAQAAQIAKSRNPLLAERAADCRDVRDRVLGKLSSEREEPRYPAYEDIILIGEHLTPSDTVALDRDHLAGFGTTVGGLTSHVAILARSMGVPAVGGLDHSVLALEEGARVVLDGNRGLIRAVANDDELREIQKSQQRRLQQRKAAMDLAKRKAVTRDGHRIEVHANINNIEEARTAVAMGADGVGLLRTEFLFTERTTAPSEDEQFAIYQEIADIFSDHPVTIRTLDVGGDKPLAYLPVPEEENPFLGLRGLRLSLRNENLLRAQLRAVLRVKSRRPLNLMFPMVATLEEFRSAKGILDDERRRLNAAPIAVGIMMEVPSVAVMAEAFAKEVDFFSIGTNDLTQYALAMDRGNSALARQSDGLHPSVLRMIDLTVRAAHANGKWVGVCGALASDPAAIPILVGLGVDELSAGLMAVSQVKAQVRELALNEARVLAGLALKSTSAGEVRELRVPVP